MKTYEERGFTYPMTPKQRERLLYSLTPDMRAVLYEVDTRAIEALKPEPIIVGDRRAQRPLR